LTSLGHPSKFQRVSRLGFVTAPTSLNGGQPNFARWLAVSSPLAPNGILPRAKFTLRPILAFFYIGCVNARHSSSGRQPNFSAFSREGVTYFHQGGHHVGHVPTFYSYSVPTGLITFRVSRIRREMYIGHARLCMCVCVCVCLCLSVCLCVCPSPHSHTTARTRM